MDYFHADRRPVWRRSPGPDAFLRRAIPVHGLRPALLGAKPLAGAIGIGHTRWATHGAATERNAHPHATEHVAVVHNGIIENFRELRQELTAAGRTFVSETDSEVIAHLISDYIGRGMAPFEATQAALARLDGAFALGVVFAGEHELLIGARRGSPLCIGWGEGEMYLGSDALALGPLSERISYLEEGDCAALSRIGAVVRDFEGNLVERPARVSAHSGALIGKGNHRHYMAKEIHEQPSVIGETLNAFFDPVNRSIRLPELPFDLGAVPKITILACGTSFYAAQIAKYWFERTAKVPVEVDIASEFRYRAPPMASGGLTLVISQSGETADTLAALRFARAQGQNTAAIVNVAESSIARESDVVLGLHAGPELGVASTKAFTCQLVALACVVIATARARGAIGGEDEATLSRAIAEVPARAAEVLNHDEALRALAHELAEARDVLYIGRGSSYPIALGRRAQAQRDFLPPRRGLRRRRAQARTHRADRRDRAGNRHRALGRSLRKDGLEHGRGDRPRRPRHIP